MKTKRKVINLAIAVGLSAAMGVASAAFVPDWDYTQEFEFTAFTPETPETAITATGETIGATDVDGNTKLEWGAPFQGGDLSSLVINPLDGDSMTPSNALTAGNVITSLSLGALTFADGPSLAHNNFPILAGDGTLLSATAEDFVRLIPADPPGGTDVERNITFNILFDETPNSLTGGNCPWNITDTPFCSDIFVISGGFPGSPTPVGQVELDGDGIPVTTSTVAFLIDSFVRDGFKYDIFLKEKTDKLVVLTDEACARFTEVGPGCIGFVTGENQTTIAQLEFAVLGTEIPVPAPGTLLLLSGGLIGLGVALRRKSRGASV